MTGGQRPILLVDDDGNDIEVAVRALRKAGIEPFVVARDGESALRYLGLERGGEGRPGPLPEVIFLDLKMPRMNGFEVLEAIRGNDSTRNIPVVVVSTSRRTEDVQRSYAMGANSFVVKQFDAQRPGGFIADAAVYWLRLNEPPPLSEPGDAR